MGHVYAQATIRGKRAAKARFLADTGATYGLISPEMAWRLGIMPGPIRDRVRPASGGTVRLPMALAAIRIDGRETGTISSLRDATEWVRKALT
jgi:predicted aspartyl protease